MCMFSIISNDITWVARVFNRIGYVLCLLNLGLEDKNVFIKVTFVIDKEAD